jgi:hypothetical protein
VHRDMGYILLTVKGKEFLYKKVSILLDHRLEYISSGSLKCQSNQKKNKKKNKKKIVNQIKSD